MRTCKEKWCSNCEYCIEKPACRWCDYFLPEFPTGMLRNELLDGDNGGNGFCICQPPCLGQMKEDKYGDFQQTPAEWPLVYDFSWCGQFKERTDLQNVSDKAIADAEDFIRNLLQAGPVTNDQVRMKVRKAGVRMNALLLASRNLRILYGTMKKLREGRTWRLPENVRNDDAGEK